MTTPTVTEIAPRPEPVVHDPFIDDLPEARAATQLGCGTMRMYGRGDSQPSGYCSFACSSLTEPAMITSSPGCHWAGVATAWLAVSCSESITRRTSSKLRPVVIG